MKPVCVPCQRFFRMKKSGYFFIEGMPKNDASSPLCQAPLPGTAEPERWQPYKIWSGDLWECVGCGAQILNGFGAHAINEHYRPDFTEQAKRLGATQLQVNDC